MDTPPTVSESPSLPSQPNTDPNPPNNNTTTSPMPSSSAADKEAESRPSAANVDVAAVDEAAVGEEHGNSEKDKEDIIAKVTNVTDLDILAIEELNQWDYPVFELSEQCGDIILTAVSLAFNCYIIDSMVILF